MFVLLHLFSPKDLLTNNLLHLRYDYPRASLIWSFRHCSGSDDENYPPAVVVGPSLMSPGRESDPQQIMSAAAMMQLRALFEMIHENLDRFVYTTIPAELGDIQCRITRDKRGVDKGFHPMYYMHAERPGDGKRVRPTSDHSVFPQWKLASCNRSLSSLDGNVDVVPHRITSCRPTPLIYHGMEKSLVGKWGKASGSFFWRGSLLETISRGNMLGTQFTVYDQGSHPKKNM